MLLLTLTFTHCHSPTHVGRRIFNSPQISSTEASNSPSSLNLAKDPDHALHQKRRGLDVGISTS
ncbi:uncharacterized protein BDZ83DRAFT_617193 [Colletotrichum acutatum]|uniref:Uncharacterized protein n=1 Tax=Glomerella acutata TaxID=27357 RepID=A0AAD8US23_GLOAC|nr:uncharacterized protein BDZ83DRAFT_617193 [Colletotrichum acutatum]KAK1726114.1 hypothetical protein BDZ83DRAFT_617193 [Colletotrichum acutatum]